MGIQVIEDPGYGGLGAQLGQSFGQGLKEGLPKGINQGALAAGLKNIEGKNLSPMGTLAALASHGVDISQAAQFLPYMQQQQAKQDFLTGGQTGQMGGNATGQPRNATGQPRNATGQPRNATGQPENATGMEGSQFTPLKGDTASLEASARQLIQKNPSRFLTIESAMDQAAKNYQNQQFLIGQTEEEFNKQVQARTQKYGKDIDQAILGDTRQNFARQAANEVASGNMTPEQAGDQFSKKALDFAKTRTQLKNFSRTILNRGGTKQALRTIRKSYRENGELENFKKDLQIYHNFSERGASLATFPVSEEFKKAIPSIPLEFSKRESPEKVYRKAAGYITPDQSLYAIANEMGKKGYNESEFLKKIGEMNQQNKIALTPMQQRELVEANKPMTMNDIFNLSWWGID